MIGYRGAIFWITHDRYFLDRVTGRIAEIDGGKLYSYDGNYDYYLETKGARKEMQLASERKRQAIYKRSWPGSGAARRPGQPRQREGYSGFRSLKITNW